MANPTDYDDFVDELWQTDDDYEPYGLVSQLSPAVYESTLQTELMPQIPLYVEDLDDWKGE